MKYPLIILIIVSAAVAQMPTDIGPYEVGCRMRTIERASDTDTTTRIMDIYIWYPADPIIGYWVDALQAYLNERPMQGDTARPVVFFSHGGCGHPLASVYYTSFLPSWGFIVVSTMHPGSMYGEPDCLDSASLHDTWLNRPGDIEFTRRWFIDLASDSANLFGVLDTSRMGMSGHSFGARTTYAMLNRTDYFLCGLAFSGNYIDRFGAPMNCMEDIRGIHQPIMIQNGTYDWGLPPDYAQEIYDTLESPKYWAEIHRVGHFQWGDTCDPALDPQCGVDSMLDYATAHYEILKYSVPFLMHYVMGDNRFDSYLVDTSDTFVTYTYDDGMSIDETELPRYINIEVYPNPFNSAVMISIGAIHELPLQIEIFDINGRIVYEMSVGARGASPPPNGNVVWSPNKSLGSGVYLVRLNGINSAKKIIYLK
ncbi:hypothetical protein DRQ36_02845 [bacterium]|nr:MAG: hypothetical protein DRQ36_02845 [bacterium]